MSADEGPAAEGVDGPSPGMRTEDDASPPLKRKISLSPTESRDTDTKRAKTQDEGITREDEAVAGTDADRHVKRRSSQEAGAPSRRPSETSTRPISPAADRRRSGGVTQEDKKRGQRLFGGLLSTLSQTTSSSQQRKRREIERRQQDRANQQKIADDKHQKEAVAKLNHSRRVAQVDFDEQVMRTRHSNMLAMAHSLKTRSNPPVYYRPWELSEDHARAIKDQIHEAKDRIAREALEFSQSKERRLKELDVIPPPKSESSGGGAPERSYPPAPESTNHAPALATKSSHDKDHDKDHDETGDVMVEAEDTVIY